MANLRNRSGFWMEASLVFNETNEKGISKEVRERYVVEAASFIDGEKKLRDELTYANRPIKRVDGMLRPKYGTICFSDDATAESFYKCKVVITEEIEVKTRKGGVRTKTKAVSHFHLVQAPSVEAARKAIVDVVYKDSNADYEVADVVKTRILDVLENDKHMTTLSDKTGTE